VAEREFPQGAAELNGDEWSRRDFLKLMGASMALAGVGLTSCRRPELHLVPFTKNVEWTIPGKFLYYATAMPRRNGAIPLLATTVDGRPIKLDGNPLHPGIGGRPTRSLRRRSWTYTTRPDPNGLSVMETPSAKISTLTSRTFAISFSLITATALRFSWKKRIRQRERLRGELEKNLPGMRWCVYEPLLSQGTIAATQNAFGAGARVIPNSIAPMWS